MKFINSIMLHGQIVSDVETKTFGAGRKLTKFRLLTKVFWKQGEEWKEKPSWHEVQAWGRLAETLEKMPINKEDSATVIGTLQYNTWEDSSGVKRTSASINAEEIIPYARGAEITIRKDKPVPDMPAPSGVPDDDEMGTDDDIPF